MHSPPPPPVPVTKSPPPPGGPSFGDRGRGQEENCPRCLWPGAGGRHLLTVPSRLSGGGGVAHSGGGRHAIPCWYSYIIVTLCRAQPRACPWCRFPTSGPMRCPHRSQGTEWHRAGPRVSAGHCRIDHHCSRALVVGGFHDRPFFVRRCRATWGGCTDKTQLKSAGTKTQAQGRGQSCTAISYCGQARA